MLHELGEILTANHLPTMTEEMARKTGTGTDSDPNKRFDLAWDPTHVWLTSFADRRRRRVPLEGGAQAEVDITQLSKRLQASAYFDDVAPRRRSASPTSESGHRLLSSSRSPERWPTDGGHGRFRAAADAGRR